MNPQSSTPPESHSPAPSISNALSPRIVKRRLLSTSAGSNNKFHASIPVPWRRFIPLLLISITHAMTYAVIFPMISDMVTSFGVPMNKVGLYAGAAEGVMMLVEVVAAPVWARLADKCGRRPVMLAGFSVCVVVCPLLGFSKTVWHIILGRACLGLNSAGILTNIIAAELSHTSNRSIIFAILAPSWSIGMVLGSAIGGELAHPHGRLPTFLSGSSQFWLDNPYALPHLIVGLIDLVCLINGLFFLVETRRTTPSSHASQSPKSQFKAALKVPNFILVTTVFLLYQISTFSWDGLYTVFTYTRPSRGGLGLPVDTIGLLYSANYLVSFAADPILLPLMEKRWGLKLALEIALLTWPVVALLLPVSQWTAVHARSGMWGVLAVQVILRAVGSVAWALCDILTINCFDNYPELMATGSAVSLIAGAGGRAFGPPLAGWLFSISTQYPAGSFLRQISWLYIVAVTIPAVVLTRYMRRGRKKVETGEREALLPRDGQDEQDIL